MVLSLAVFSQLLVSLFSLRHSLIYPRKSLRIGSLNTLSLTNFQCYSLPPRFLMNQTYKPGLRL